MTKKTLLDAEAFSLKPDALLAWQSPDLLEDIDVEVIIDNMHNKIDKKHLEETTYHAIYRIRSQRGVENWGSVWAGYSPWYQVRPSIRARVISPDGSVTHLDQKTIVETANRSEHNVYTDRKSLRAPLPNLCIGCIVEYEIVKKDHHPFFSAGVAGRFARYVHAFTQFYQIRITAPESLKLRYELRGSEIKPDHTIEGGEQHLRFVWSNVLPVKEFPPTTAPNVVVLPTVDYSSGNTWQDVARSYKQIVDKQLEGFESEAEKMGRALVGATDERKQKINRLLHYIHKNVRYTGLELGEKSLVPEKPQNVLKRGYGDCKDKATLLVGLLRAQGMDAHVALLDVGPGLDVNQKTPGMGVFNHAIVYVSGADPIWIDPSNEYAGANELPYTDEDRLALIASADTTSLIKTPAQDAKGHGFVEEVHIDFVDDGKAKVTEYTSATGRFAVNFRSAWDMSFGQLEKRNEEYVKDRYGAQMESVKHESVKDYDKPVKLVIKANSAKKFQTYDNGGLVYVAPSELFAYLPSVLFEEEDKDKTDKSDSRWHEFGSFPVYIDRPHSLQTIYQLRLSDGFSWHTQPETIERSACGISVSRKARQIDDSTLEVVYTVMADTRVIKIQDVKKVGEMLRDFKKNSGAELRFVHKAYQAIVQGDLEKGLRIHRELIQKEQKNSLAKVRYAQSLLGLGFGKKARELIRKLAKEHPTDPRVQATLGYVMMFDELGRERFPGSDIKESRQAYRRAFELSPKEYYIQKGLILALTIGDNNVLYGNGAKLDEALQVIEKIQKDKPNKAFDEEILLIHLWQGHFAKALEKAQSLEGSDLTNVSQIAALAAVKGALNAERKAREIAPRNSANLLVQAVGLLANMRHYKPALELTSLPIFRSQSIAVSGKIEFIKRAAAYQTCIDKMHPAAKTSFEWIYQLVGQQITPSQVLEMLRQKAERAFIDEESLNKLAEKVANMGLTTSHKGINPWFIADSLACNISWTIDEGNQVARVSAASLGSRDKDEYYLVKNKNNYALVATSADFGVFSQLIFHSLENNKIEQTRQWLVWAKEYLRDMGGKRDFYVLADAFSDAYDGDINNATYEDVSLLASILAAYKATDKAEAILTKAIKKTDKTTRKWQALAFSLAVLHFRNNPKRAAYEFGQLHERFPHDKNIFKLHVESLFRNQQIDASANALTAYSKRYPADDSIDHFGAYLKMKTDKYSNVLEKTTTRLHENKASPTELNTIAWGSLFFGNKVNEQVIELAKNACRMTNNNNGSILHTLATLYAERGDYAKARGYLGKMLEMQESTEIPSAAWYTFGRIAEGLGLLESAKQAYTRVEPPDDVGDRESCHVLAKKRLEVLGEKSSKTRHSARLSNR